MLKRLIRWTIRSSVYLILYVTSLTPLYLMLLVKNSTHLRLNEIVVLQKLKLAIRLVPKRGFEKIMPSIYTMFFLIALSIGLFLILLIYYWNLDSGYDITNPIEQIKRRNWSSTDIMTYTATYIIPITSVNLTKASSIIMNVILLAVFGMSYIANKQFYMNPLLHLFRFTVVQCDNIVIISREDFYVLRAKVKECSFPQKVFFSRALFTDIYLLKPHR